MRICEPSTSASVIMMILWYLSFSRSRSSPNPVPKAVMMVRISWLDSILSSLAFSTLRILPRRGSIAWVRLSRPCLAEPPAESPSTRKSSAWAGSLAWQSASFPGRFATSRAPLRRVSSFAFLAASRALAASVALVTILRPTEGFSSRKAPSISLTMTSTMPLISLLPSLVLVCPSNWGSGSLTEITAASPSRISSPDSPTLTFLRRLFDTA